MYRHAESGKIRKQSTHLPGVSLLSALSTASSTSSLPILLASSSYTSALKLLIVLRRLNCPFSFPTTLGLLMRVLASFDPGRRSGIFKACGWSSGNAATAKMPSREMMAGRAGSVGDSAREGCGQQKSDADLLEGMAACGACAVYVMMQKVNPTEQIQRRSGAAMRVLVVMRCWSIAANGRRPQRCHC